MYGRCPVTSKLIALDFSVGTAEKCGLKDYRQAQQFNLTLVFSAIPSGSETTVRNTLRQFRCPLRVYQRLGIRLIKINGLGNGGS